MTVFRAATLRTFFFAFHAGAKELMCERALRNPKVSACGRQRRANIRLKADFHHA